MHTNRQKKRLQSFLFWKEVVMYGLALASILLLILEHLEHLTHEQLLFVETFDVLVGIIFLAEFAFELHHAKDKKLYWKNHWYYLFAAVPLPQQSFALLRGIRLIRALRLLEAFTHLRYEHNTRLFETSKEFNKD